MLRIPPTSEIPARSESVGSTELCTVLGDPNGASVATVEHLLAALAGLSIDNAVIEIDGPEVPVMDGSARAFVDAIDQAGIVAQSAPRRFIRIDKPVRVELGDGIRRIPAASAACGLRSASTTTARSSAGRRSPST